MKKKPSMADLVEGMSGQIKDDKPLFFDTDEEKTTTGFNVPKSFIKRLRELAVTREQKRGGRISTSSVVTDILGHQMDEYERRLNELPNKE
jgi:hypothetical protein